MMMRLPSLLAVLLLLVAFLSPSNAFWWGSKEKTQEEEPESKADAKGTESGDSERTDGIEPAPVCNDSSVDDPAQAVKIEYGADVSFPMLHKNVIPNSALGDRQAFYDDHITSCVEYYGDKGRRCLDNEVDRIEMASRQIPSMRNYTEHGFAKIRAPEHVYKLLKDFWEANGDEQSEESWPAGNTYVSHWHTPSYMVSVEDNNLKGGGFTLKQHIWNAARDTLQQWTGQRLAECSLYGIRVYKENAVLAPHVDRLPLVTSAIIQVDQDVDEPWPLEVIGHDGRAHNVTMEPGDMVLYESHSVIHGRPFPLKGRYYANVFIHFEPVGPLGGELEYGKTEIPPYVMPGSREEAHWRRTNPGGHELLQSLDPSTRSNVAHVAAREGNLEQLKVAVETNPDVVNAKDSNGWSPLHEAVRFGDPKIVEYLMEHGADVNLRTEGGKGGSPLWWALKYFGEDHGMIKVLHAYGAKNYAPGQKHETGDAE